MQLLDGVTMAMRAMKLYGIAGRMLVGASALSLAGCALGTLQPSGSVVATSSSGVTISGGVHGGQQAVSGSTIQLYAAGTPAMPSSGGSTGGYGQGATALIPMGSMSVGSTNNYLPGGASGCAYTAGNTNQCTALPQTDANGLFTITGDYTCPSSESQVYMVATGGNPGLSGPVNNSYLALMAGLGPCAAGGTLSPSLSIDLNEVTTVATVWALQQFMTTPVGTAASGYASQGGTTAGAGVSIGAPSGPAGGYGASGVQTSVSGLKNAFAMINNLTNVTTGSSGTGSAGSALNSWATPWGAKINTIADILAACVNTDPTSGDSNCTTLMTNATPASSTAAKDTIQAAWYMAQNPTNNVGALFGLVSSTPPFSGLSSVPNDWGIFVGLAPTYSGGSGAVASPFNGAVDEYGHVWLTNFNPTGAPFLSELGGDGSTLAGPFASYTANGGYASGCSTTDTHTLATGSTGPKGIAIDLSNVVWVNNPNETACTGSVHTMMRVSGSAGYSPSSPGYVAPSVASGYFESGSTYSGIAVDGSNNVYIANSGSTGKLMIFAAGSGTYTQGASLGSSSPSWISIDNSAAGNGPFLWSFGSKDCSTNIGQMYQQPVSNLTATTSVDTYQNAACSGGTVGTTGTITNINAAFNTPYMASVDRNNGIWAAQSTANTVSWYLPNSTGALDTTNATSVNAPPGLGGIVTPFAVAVDGNNYAWVGSSGSGQPYYVSVLQGNAGSPLTISLAPPLQGTGNSALGFAYTGSSNPFLHAPRGMAVDPSGNIWFFNNSTTTNYNWVSVLVGQAAPVITPIALQVKAGMIGQKP